MIDKVTEKSDCWYNQRRSLRYRLTRQLSHLTRGRIRSPEFQALAAEYRLTDGEDKSKNRPLDDQHVSTWAIWAVEAYTPATISNLVRGLEGLSADTRDISTRDAAAWLKEQRNHPGSSFFLRLSNPASTFLPAGFKMELPSFAKYAVGTIWTATPSLTLLTIAFIFNDDERSHLDGILHSDYATRLEALHGRGISIHSPESERRRLIAQTRKHWADTSSKWFRNFFPGLLASSGDGVAMCEIAVLENLMPFPIEPKLHPQGYCALSTLEMFHEFEAFRGRLTNSASEFTFAPFYSGDRQGFRYSIVAMTKEAFESQNADTWGMDQSRYLHAFESSFRNIVALSAITHVFEHYRQSLAAIRDLLVNVIAGHNSVKAIARLRNDTMMCADAATVARDIKSGIAQLLLFGGHGQLTVHKTGDVGQESFLQVVFRRSTMSKANHLIEDVNQLDATLNSQAALLSAHATLRLQPWVIILAIVSAMASIIPPAQGLIKWLTDKVL